MMHAMQQNSLSAAARQTNVPVEPPWEPDNDINGESYRDKQRKSMNWANAAGKSSDGEEGLMTSTAHLTDPDASTPSNLY